MKSRRFPPILLIALAGLLVGACGKAPLVPDAPKGPAQWMRNTATACTTSTTDESGVQVSYEFDWGDGNKSEWSLFMDGGVPFADTHSTPTSARVPSGCGPRTASGHRAGPPR